MVSEDKKAKAAWRRKFDLHTLLIMEAHGLSKADAMVEAYFEGIDGLKKRQPAAPAATPSKGA